MLSLIKCQLTVDLIRCFEPLLIVITEAMLVVAFRQHHDVCPVSGQQLHAGLYHLKLMQRESTHDSKSINPC